jgi:hypothetical protein
VAPDRRWRGGRWVALALALVLAVPVAQTAAVHRAPVAPGQSSAQQVDGSDACGLLSDQEILRATGAPAVLSRSPGSQSMMTAGCYWELEAIQAEYGPWELWLGVEPTGGRERFESELAYYDGFERQPQRVAGIGDDAFIGLAGDWLALKGDTLISVQYVAFGGAPRPNSLTARSLAWLAMQRIEGGRTASVPTAPPLPSAIPVTEARRLVEAVRAEPFAQANIDAVIEILARSGIGTYQTADAPEPIRPVEGVPSPVTLLVEQVRAMALEAWSGSGLLGRDLDPLVPAEPELATPSLIVAGYVAAVDTEGAAVARQLMGEQDWAAAADLVFPQLVLTLFTSDIVRERMETTPVAARAGTDLRPVPLAAIDGPRTAQAGICSAAVGFLNGTLDRVFNALRLGGSGFGVVVATIWNFVVSIAERTVRELIAEVTQPVLDMIGRVAAMAGMVASIVSAIRPWTVSVTAQPGVTAKGVGGSPGQAGQIVVRVDLGGFDEWPPYVEDCARVAGHPLPNLKPEGAPVTWEPLVQQPGALVAEGPRQARLDAEGVAKLDFQTLVDDLPAPWEDRAGVMSSRVTVERPALEDLRKLAVNELFALLPTLVRGIVEPYLRPTVDQLAQRLTALISASASGPATVIYHVPAATPPPGATPVPTPQPRQVWVYSDRPAIGDSVQAGRVIELYSCGGPYGPWSGVLRAGGMSAVPFKELPLSFAFRGSSGVQRAQVTVSGVLDTIVPDIKYPVTFVIDIGVDGSDMTLGITGTAGEVIQGEQLFQVQGDAGRSVLPIEPAAAGTC